MASNKIKFTINESRDYAILQYEDFFREGHVIDSCDWMDLVEYLGYEIKNKEISDEEMEKINYEEI